MTLGYLDFNQVWFQRKRLNEVLQAVAEKLKMKSMNFCDYLFTSLMTDIIFSDMQ